MQVNLLEKTELKIYGLVLNEVNLTAVAAIAAGVLGLPTDKVLVVDVREDHICLDLLVKTIDLEQIAGREKMLLDALRDIEGLEVAEGAYVDSAGIMGLIGCEEAEAAGIVARAEALGSEVEKAVLGRAMIFATGFEVADKMIEDTNSPYLIHLLSSQGYAAQFGGTLADNKTAIRLNLLDAADSGFGLVITTGGVGAEDKDFSVEAVLAIDPEAATPWIAKFRKGTGRHIKEGIRIAVGQSGLTTFVSLPGPHDEVVAASEALRTHCSCGHIDKHALAGSIARILREKLHEKMGHYEHNWREHHG